MATAASTQQRPGREIDQYNALVALDPALALVNSSPYFEGRRLAAGRRAVRIGSPIVSGQRYHLRYVDLGRQTLRMLTCYTPTSSYTTSNRHCSAIVHWPFMNYIVYKKTFTTDTSLSYHTYDPVLIRRFVYDLGYVCDVTALRHF